MTKSKKIILTTLIIILAVSFAIASKGALIDDLPSTKSLLERLLPFIKKSDNSAAPLQISTLPTVTPLPTSDQTSQGAFAYENQIVRVVDHTSPSVVSIILTKNVPVYEQYLVSPFNDSPFGDMPGFQIEIPQLRQNGTKKQEVGGGSGFVISADGLILTNRHVVEDTQGEYTVITNDGKKYPATILARDPSEDLAIVKINASGLSMVALGDSDGLKIGQTAIAIGNALGEFRNTVSAGVVSGLSRTINASGTGQGSELLENVIQTDAAINKGNSGGPLLNLRGEVIGINTATVEGAQSIGFAIPINRAKIDIQSVETSGKLVLPFLGVQYIMLNPQVAQALNISTDHGALIKKGNSGSAAIVTDSPAEKIGLKEGDIILQVNDTKVVENNPLGKILRNYKVGDIVKLSILRGGQPLTFNVSLAERK